MKLQVLKIWCNLGIVFRNKLKKENREPDQKFKKTFKRNIAIFLLI